MGHQKYIDFALAQGAKNAVHVTIEQIAFDSRAYLKCVFGCNGGNPDTLCPSQPGRIMPWEYETILKRYSWGILIHSNSNHIAQQISLDLEKKAFLDGYYFAFSLNYCSLCDNCNRFDGKSCVRYSDVRPSMEGVGIDVFKTIRGIGLPIEVLKEKDEEENRYALVLVE